MDERDKRDETAEALLEGSGLSVLEAARLALELHEMAPPKHFSQRSPMAHYRRVINMGADAYEQMERTVSFQTAVEKSLHSRAGRRHRTLAEIRQCCRRCVHCRPELAQMPMRSITPEFCRELITSAYHTLPMQRKARRLLHGIFAFSMRHGWCSGNPAMAVDIPSACEKKIDVLNMVQVRRLLATTLRPEHLPCAPAVGLMLWAGIRPPELTRLHWEDVHFGDRVITIDARHAKTGGARHVTLHAVLAKWLRENAPYRLPRALIVPRAWIRRWRALRLAAGFSSWNPDTLRHTFASYHLKYFQDMSKLQLDMGHGSGELLRTRYLSMRGVTLESAMEFWGERRPPAQRTDYEHQ